jgi:beta-glucosidase
MYSQWELSLGMLMDKERTLLGSYLKTGRKNWIYMACIPKPATVENRKSIDILYMTNCSAFLVGYKQPQISDDPYYITMKASLSPPKAACITRLTFAGTGVLFIDGELVVNNKTTQQ